MADNKKMETWNVVVRDKRVGDANPANAGRVPDSEGRLREAGGGDISMTVTIPAPPDYWGHDSMYPLTRHQKDAFRIRDIRQKLDDEFGYDRAREGSKNPPFSRIRLKSIN